MTGKKPAPPPDGAAPELFDLYGRWIKHADGCRLPTSTDIDVDDLFSRYQGAGIITVGERKDGSPRYFNERVNDTHEKLLGRAVQGYWVDEIVPVDHIQSYERVYSTIISERRPHYWMRMNTPLGTEVIDFERLLVPVSDDGAEVTALVGVWVVYGPDGKPRS